MTKERISIDLDMPDFQPRSRPKEAIPEEVREIAARRGFTARHAPPAPEQAVTPAPAAFDARSLRRTNRNAKLNIATTEESRQRFWTLAQRVGSTVGEEVLIAMMDAFERDLAANGR